MPIDKTNAIFKIETVDGKQYRVMYFKGRDGRLIRSKFPQLLKTSQPQFKKKLKSKPAPQIQKPVYQSQTRPSIDKEYTVKSGNANNLVNEWESLANKR